ncbi:MAG: RDD family protein [Gammaproteobacteria bacterium]|nr:RDD family protein [Gammaproteobacteria bacterium]
MNDTASPDKPVYAGLFRRLFAIFYDSFLLIAILFIVTAIATALNQGNAIEPDDTFYPLYVFIVFSLSYLYFAWFWIHGGQSLGMKTWRIQLRSTDNRKIGWKTAGIRFVIALFSWGFFGLGFLWALFDKKNRCWHDLASHTELLDLKTSNKN